MELWRLVNHTCPKSIVDVVDDDDGLWYVGAISEIPQHLLPATILHHERENNTLFIVVDSGSVG